MLVQGNGLIATNLSYATIISEANLPLCSKPASPCHFYVKANHFISSEQYPFLLAVLERVEIAQDDLSLRNIFLMKNDNSLLDDEIVYRAFVKQTGYISRLFNSAETWDEWTEYKTPLGRVVSNFLEYAFQHKVQQAKLLKRSQPWMEKANHEAQELLKNLSRPLREKIELLRSDQCFDKAKEAKIEKCYTPETEALIHHARSFQAQSIRLKINEDCCVKMALRNETTVEKKQSSDCKNKETQLHANIYFYRNGRLREVFPQYCNNQ
jgi:hypothetical protein